MSLQKPRLSNPIYREFFENRSWITSKHIFHKHLYSHLFRQRLVVGDILGQKVVSSRPIFRSRNDSQTLSRNHYNTHSYHRTHNGGSDVYYLTFLDFPGSPGSTLRETSNGMKDAHNRTLEQTRQVSKKLVEMFQSTHNSIKDK